MKPVASMHILLVDDEAEFLHATQIALQRRGFSVTTASDGRAALALAEQFAFDVVVLDGKMPGMSAWSECRRTLRNESQNWCAGDRREVSRVRA